MAELLGGPVERDHPRGREERRARLLEEADSCRSFLRGQEEIRVFVEHAHGRGHQASSITLLRHLIRIVPLSRSTRVTMVVEDEQAERMLAQLLPVPPRGRAADLDGVPLRFRSVEEIRREPWIDFGCTGASDSRRDLARRVRCRSFLWMQPYRWVRAERIGHRSRGVTAYDALATHPWTADLTRRFPAFALPPPAEPDWAGLGESRSLRIIRAALAAGRRPEVALLPVYGMRRGGALGESHVLLRNVLLGARDAQARGLAAAVLVLDLSVDGEPEALGRLRESLDRRENGLSLQACTGLEEDPDRVRSKIDRLRAGGLLLVHAGGYKPQAVFEHVLAQAGLPFLFEGAGTATRAVTLGRPFLQVSTLSFRARRLGRQPRRFEMSYPFLEGCGRSLPHTLQKAADSVLLLKPAPSLLGSVLLGCARGDAMLLHYFAAMKRQFGDPRNDRLLLALGLFELLRRRKELRGLGRIPRWTWDPIRGTREEA